MTKQEVMDFLKEHENESSKRVLMRHGAELAQKWIRSEEEMVAAAGWATYASLVAITADQDLDTRELRALLKEVEETIHAAKNRVRYAMNGFVISVGSYVVELTAEAKGRVGKKRRGARC